MKRAFLNRFISLILAGVAVFSVMPFVAVRSSADNDTIKELNVNTVYNRIEELCNKLCGKYFTVNGNYCLPPESSESGHGCENCNNENIIKAAWLKKAVGKVPDDVRLLPSFNTPDGGHIKPPAKSCAGFAMFAAWYIAADEADEALNHQSRHNGSSVDFTLSNIKKYAKPGDIIYGSNYHGIIFIEVKDDKIVFVDSNGTRKEDGNCYVRKAAETIDTMKSYMGSTVAITGFYKPMGTLNAQHDFSFLTLLGKATVISYNKTSSKVSVPQYYKIYPVTTIAKNAFYKKTSLTEVTLPASITEINSKAFYGCVNLKKIIIPESVVKIDSDAFLKCQTLRIYGYDGTYALDFAKKNGIKAVSLGKAPCRHKCTHWVVTKKATVKEAGEKKLVCDECKKTISVSAIPFIFKGWIKEGGKWYYYKNKVMQTGWVKDNGNWYYLAQNGQMKTGWVYVKDKWYYLNASGRMLTGWLKYNEKWYYLDPSGAMVTGKVKIGGQYYEFNEKGVCLNP